MRSFYEGVHAILRGLLYAENLYVALYDEERQLISFPYYVDLVDQDVPDPRQWDALGTGEASGVTGYILRAGKTHHASTSEWLALVASKEVSAVGAPPSDYIGVPLKADGRTIGVLAVQSYEPGGRYSEADEQLLEFVADHIATALAKTRAISALRERNAELAIVNEVGQALSQQLDLEAVAEHVGDRLVATFPGVDLFVALYDTATNMISFPYETRGTGERYYTAPLPADKGLTATVIQTRKPVLIRTQEEATAAGAIQIGDDISRSWLGGTTLLG
jgi:transcriptional regulator with GAF, ATPase, and Fis domain